MLTSPAGLVDKVVLDLLGEEGGYICRMSDGRLSMGEFHGDYPLRMALAGC